MAVIGRPRAFDRDAALEAAMLVFWRKGFSAASMNDLCDAMGIRSPSLYAAFGSKEPLSRSDRSLRQDHRPSSLGQARGRGDRPRRR
jgi:AcrR family transcriptional regulator